MDIGRKIYYEKTTGNFIVDTGERQGSVIETTTDQDFQAYTALQPYLQSAVGVIQMLYGQFSDSFLKYPFHVDITKSPIGASAIVWDASSPLGATLEQVQQAKIAQITDLYNQKLEAGFNSSATGTAHTFGYAQSDQMKFMQLAILELKGLLPFPTDIPAKDNTKVSHTKIQYDQLIMDIAVFAQTQNSVQHQFIDQVNACTNIQQVNDIVVQF